VTGAGTFWQGAAKGSNIIGDGQGGWNLIRGKESHGHEEKGNLIMGSYLGRPGGGKGIQWAIEGRREKYNRLKALCRRVV